MKLSRVYAIVLRNLFTFRRNYDRMFDAFYWPIMDLVIWGLTSSYLVHIAPGLSKLVVLFVSGLSFWLIVIRSQYETNVSLLEEIWSRNLINIFVSPITFYEWILGITIIGIIKSAISFITATLVAFILYRINIFHHGPSLLPLILLLLMTGWWVSYFIAGAILRFGTKVQTFAWTLAFLLAPFSGIYYPVSALPDWAENISYIIPTSYVFDGLRSIINTGSYDSSKIFISFLLNIIFLLSSLLYLKRSFNVLLKNGILQVK